MIVSSLSTKSRATTLKKIFAFMVLLAAMNTIALAQVAIKRSETTEIIDGKKYYLHTVEKGQTLYSISKAYHSSVDKLLSENPDAIDGLKTGMMLKIPATSDQVVIPSTSLPKPTATVKMVSPKPIEPIDSTSEKRDSVITISADTNFSPIKEIHVAAFLPLGLDAVNDIDVQKMAHSGAQLPEDNRIGIEFYQGLKIAFDSLRTLGFNGHLHIYDSDADSLKFDKIVSSGELKKMNLIIGPLYGKKFEQVLRYARDNKIGIVSPTLQGNSLLLGHPASSKITPSFVVQCDFLSKYAISHFSHFNILVFNSAMIKDRPYVNTVSRKINEGLKLAQKDTAVEVTFTTINNFINKTKPNLIVIPSTNPSVITEIVNKIFLHQQESKDSLRVMGMSNFMEIESLDFNYQESLGAVVSGYKFVTDTAENTKVFSLKYLNQFKTIPSQYAYLGFDAGYYYLKGLQDHGHRFLENLDKIPYSGLQSRLQFKRSASGSGFENYGAGIFEFKNYEYKLTD